MKCYFFNQRASIGARKGHVFVKSFSLELKDLDSGDYWRIAQVFYEGEAVYFVLTPDGRFLRLSELSDHDRARVERDLIYNLSADARERGA